MLAVVWVEVGETGFSVSSLLPLENPWALVTWLLSFIIWKLSTVSQPTILPLAILIKSTPRWEQSQQDDYWKLPSVSTLHLRLTTARLYRRGQVTESSTMESQPESQHLGLSKCWAGPNFDIPWGLMKKNRKFLRCCGTCGGVEASHVIAENVVGALCWKLLSLTEWCSQLVATLGSERRK